MMLYNIPISKDPNQTFTTELDGKMCEFEIISRYGYTFMNLTVDDSVVFKGFICHNNQNLLQYNHFNMEGELKFIDSQGTNDPVYDGFNERYFLVYVL